MANVLGAVGGFLGTNASTNTSAPQVNSNAFQYGGGAGGAQGQQNLYQAQASNAQGRQGAQINNTYDSRDQSAVQGTLGGMSSLGSYYQGVMNGTQPSLAQAQMQQSTDQNINAQMAMAHSTGGALASAAANRNASNYGQNAMNQAAQQSMIGRIQEEQNAASGMSNLLQNQGQLGLGEQGLNAGQALAQAQLQQNQNSLNDQMTLGSQGMANQIGLAQLQAQMQQQSLQSQNQLSSEGLAAQQAQANAANNANLLGGVAGAVGGALLAADADLKEPGGGAHWTLREEPDFILAKNQRTGELRKVATQPLSDEEMRQAMARHGAGPLGSADPRRQRTTFSDLTMANPQMAVAMPPPPSAQQVQQAQATLAQRPMTAGQGIGSALTGFGAGMSGNLASVPGLISAQQQRTTLGPRGIQAADLDMGGPRPTRASMMTGMQSLQRRMADLEARKGR
jgi:hypothetical protein